MKDLKLSLVLQSSVITIKIIVLLLPFSIKSARSEESIVKIAVFGINSNPAFSKHDRVEIISDVNVTLKVLTTEVEVGENHTMPTFDVILESEDDSSAEAFFEEIHVHCDASFPVEWNYVGDGVSYAELFNHRHRLHHNDTSFLQHVSSLVFRDHTPFTENSAGRYYCSRRKTNEDLPNTTYNAQLGYYDIVMANATSWNQSHFRNSSLNTCQKSIPSDKINFYYNKTEEAWICCGKAKSVTLVYIPCETPGACKLRERCAEEDFHCSRTYNKTFVNHLQQTCVTANRITTDFTQSGEMICYLDNQCAKYMTYVGDNNFNGSVYYPIDSTSLFIPPEDALRVSYLKNSKTIGFRCEGPYFYFEFGFKWMVKSKNNSVHKFYGQDGDYGTSREVFNILDVSLLEMGDSIISVTCVAPLLNSPTKYAEKTIAYVS